MTTIPEKLMRRIISERRDGAPDITIARYVITEALHALTGHDGAAADCTPCHEAMTRAVRCAQTDGDVTTGASLVVPGAALPLPHDPDGVMGETVTDLDQAIRARLDLDEPSEDSRDLLDDWDAAARALLAVLDLHKQAELGLFVAKGPKCQHCYGEIGDVEDDCGDWPCETVRVIAEKLGVEADGA